jgi:thiosulfate/3-mercaptopyruvate sulfurtransferase
MDPSAARIAWTLMYHGHSNVKILDVGLNEWQKSGLPVTRHISTQKQLNKNVHFKSKINSMIRADADVIKAKQLQNHSSTVIVDARTSREHMQARFKYGQVVLSMVESFLFHYYGLGPSVAGHLVLLHIN